MGEAYSENKSMHVDLELRNVRRAGSTQWDDNACAKLMLPSSTDVTSGGQIELRRIDRGRR